MRKARVVIKELEANGWQLRNFRGSHRQFVHPTKPGRVTVAGHLGDDISRAMLASIRRQAGLK